MKLSTYAKINGISYRTAYRYWKNGILKGRQMPTGTILIDINNEEQLNEFLESNICIKQIQNSLVFNNWT